jgi:hypothetical protein
MGYTHEARFKKQFKLEKVWNMSVKDIVEISGLDEEELQGVYLTTLATTKSRASAINEVCGYAMKRLFPHKKPDDVANGRTDTT